MSNLTSCRLDTAANLTVGCILLFLTGALYSLGVFNEAVEQSAKPPGALNGVWSSSMVWMSLFSVPVMLLGGVFMSEDQEEDDDDDEVLRTRTSKTYKIRFLSAVGAFSFLSMSLAAIGILRSSRFLLRSAVLLQGLPFGIYYLVVLELLAAWVPTQPGLAIGVGQMSFGFGWIFFSSFFEYLLQHFQCSTAFLITSVFLAVPSAACVMVMKWPCAKRSAEQNVSDVNANRELRNILIPWRRLPFILPFWNYVGVIFVGQIGYALIPYFFSIGNSFGKSMDEAVTSFEVAILCSTVARPVIGILADSLKWGNGSFSIASKNVISLLFILQMLSFIGLISFSQSSNYTGFVVCASVTFVVFSGIAVEAPILARDMFSPVNSSLVFGVGASIAMGFGEFLAGEMMAAVDSASSIEGFGPAKYDLFYVLSIGICIFGLMFCIMLQKYAPPCQSTGTNSAFISIGNAGDRTKEGKRIMNADAMKAFYGAVP